MGRTVMQRIANPYYVFKRRVGSTPTSSAIILLMLLASCHPVQASESFLQQYTEIEYDGTYCKKYKSWYAYYLPLGNKIVLCKENITRTFPQSQVQKRIKSALAHEATHLAQDCKAGIHNKQMHVLNTGIKVSKYVKARYTKDDHMIESEAWKYQSSNEPYRFVEKHCNKLN